MTKSVARLQSWMLWVAGLLAVAGAINVASLPLKILFFQINLLMPVVGVLCLASAYAASERASVDAASPSLGRTIRNWALIVLAVASFVTIVPLVALPLDLAFLRLDMLMLLIGFGCLFFAYVGTRA
ncbi:MAG: hypothetical protein ABL996_13685 [Micropepsaceae bacterium]